MAQVSADEIRRALQDVDYPATKQELGQAAAGAGAGEGVVKALRALPPEEYRSTDEVIRSVDTVEATGQSPADKAVRAREHDHPGLAEHMKDAQGPRLDPDQG
jgi:hypothetical protein